MAIPAEYGAYVVMGWLLVAALIGGLAVVQMMRHKTLPVLLTVIAFSMAVGGLVLFPAPLLNLSSVTLLKWFLIFVLADMLIMALVIRFQVKK